MLEGVCAGFLLSEPSPYTVCVVSRMIYVQWRLTKLGFDVSHSCLTLSVYVSVFVSFMILSMPR